MRIVDHRLDNISIEFPDDNDPGINHFLYFLIPSPLLLLLRRRVISILFLIAWGAFFICSIYSMHECLITELKEQQNVDQEVFFADMGWIKQGSLEGIVAAATYCLGFAVIALRQSVTLRKDS